MGLTLSLRLDQQRSLGYVPDLQNAARCGGGAAHRNDPGSAARAKRALAKQYLTFDRYASASVPAVMVS
jgi:hypothetical protein